MEAQLHRFIVTSPHSGDTPIVVFFEVAADRAHRVLDRLELGLSIAWCIERKDLQVLDIKTETELGSQAERWAWPLGDVALFVISEWHEQPIFAHPAETMMLVTPPTLSRLLDAQRRLPIVVADDSAPMPLGD